MARVVHSATMLVTFSVAYALAVLAGRATRLAGGEVALVWPAAAVAIIWLLVTRRCGRVERVIHLVMLAVLTFVMNVVTGARTLLSTWFALVNVTLSVVTVSVLTHRRRDAVLRDPADLARLIAAVVAGACAGAVLATAFLSLASEAPVWQTFALFAVRNGTSALLGLAIWLRLHDVQWKRPRASISSVIEAIVVSAGMAFVFFWIFWLNTGVRWPSSPWWPRCGWRCATAPR